MAMKELRKLSAVAFISLFVTCGPLSDYFYHEGYIYDSATRSPIPDATVTMIWHLHAAFTRTDSRGFYSVALDVYPDSGYVACINISKQGYQGATMIVNSGDNRYADTVYLSAKTDSIPGALMAEERMLR